MQHKGKSFTILWKILFQIQLKNAWLFFWSNLVKVLSFRNALKHQKKYKPLIDRAKQQQICKFKKTFIVIAPLLLLRLSYYWNSWTKWKRSRSKRFIHVDYGALENWFSTKLNQLLCIWSYINLLKSHLAEHIQYMIESCWYLRW